MCPATPSANPCFAKMRKASARRCLRYLRSSYLSSKEGKVFGTSSGIVRRGSPLLYGVGVDVVRVAEGAMVGF